jgi:hypothetical protein
MPRASRGRPTKVRSSHAWALLFPVLSPKPLRTWLGLGVSNRITAPLRTVVQFSRLVRIRKASQYSTVPVTSRSSTRAAIFRNSPQTTGCTVRRRKTKQSCTEALLSLALTRWQTASLSSTSKAVLGRPGLGPIRRFPTSAPSAARSRLASCWRSLLVRAPSFGVRQFGWQAILDRPLQLPELDLDVGQGIGDALDPLGGEHTAQRLVRSEAHGVHINRASIRIESPPNSDVYRKR